MAPSIDDFGGKVNPATLLEFVDNGGTIFAATDTTVGEVLRELAAEVGVEIDEAGTKPGIDFFLMISSIESYQLLKYDRLKRDMMKQIDTENNLGSKLRF